MRPRQLIALLAAAIMLSACSQADLFNNALVSEAKVTEPTRATELLRSIPAVSGNRIAVAVYSFDDQTGQFKASTGSVAEYSSAVTKGGLAILNNALLDAANHKFFTVVERGGLQNLMTERQLIRISAENLGNPDPKILSLTYAGMMITGGVVGYDTNTVTGGFAANYFGIGGTSEYRSDTVTVFLRAVSIQTGEVILSVTSTKTIYSTALQGNIFRYLTSDRILQSEAGFTLNEPVNLAVRQAIETGVYSLVMEGALNNYWSFADANAGKAALKNYLERRTSDGDKDPITQDKSKLADLRRQQEESSRPAPQPAPAPEPVAARPLPAPAPTAPMPIEQAPVPVLEKPRSSNTLPAPAPKQEVKTITPPAPTPQIVRPADPNALVRYLHDSRYNGSRKPNNGKPCQEVLPSGECKE